MPASFFGILIVNSLDKKVDNPGVHVYYKEVEKAHNEEVFV